MDECNARGIAFVPFCPLGFPRAQRDTILTNPVVADVARRHDATAAQVALAWLLSVAPNVLLIPGTRARNHLAENLAAGELWLSDHDISVLNGAFEVQAIITRVRDPKEPGAADHRDRLAVARRKRADVAGCTKRQVGRRPGLGRDFDHIIRLIRTC